MKKLLIILFILFYFHIFGLNLLINNPDFQIKSKGDFTSIEIENESFFPDLPGAPSIPLNSHFFQIPNGKKIGSVSIIPQNIKTQILGKKILPIQKQYPLNYEGEILFNLPEPAFYDSDKFPANLVYNFGAGQLGNHKIGFISFYSFEYFPAEVKIEIPESFIIEIELEYSSQCETFPDNFAVSKILESMKINQKLSRDFTIKYLLITPDIFLDEYNDLLNWRKIQGLETFVETVENIENNFTGIDLQEKIRNFIIEMCAENEISFVTFGADIDLIPDRKVFAFDCGIGLFADENDIPADMYYSCLDGNWDANGNEIYGEEDDETDYFPEVFVGRIPANNEDEVINYISRLIDYESGIHPNYHKAAGFSQELWPGSNSQVCQQYIYENYFPEYYDISFIYDSENTQANAYAILNNNQNFIQHTGHAGKNSLSLEDGRIKISNLNLLNNDWGGMLYSIGCFSAAFDYETIGELLVVSIDKGLLGYVGNSRYGWGAPSSPGFGFSEFYQKEFFKTVFWENKTFLSEINALQKIPFIPYFGGTSVYKWVAYELNSFGDSYLNFFLQNPEEFDFSITALDSIYINVSNDGIPVENVVITKAEEQAKTDVNGNACLLNNGLYETIYLYKYGYKIQNFQSSQIINYPYIGNISGNEEVYYLQNENLTINSTFFNPTFMVYDFYVEYEWNENEIDIVTYENPNHIIDFSCAELSPIDIHIKSVAESFQMENEKEIYLWEKIYDNATDTLLAQAGFVVKIKSPELTLNSLDYEIYNVVPGAEIPITFEIENTGSVDAAGLTCNFSSESDFITFVDSTYSPYLLMIPGQTEELGNIINISEDAPEDFLVEFNIELITSNSGQNYVFPKIVLISSGNIGFFEDFENGLNWNCSAEWQTVDTYSYSGDYSLSCRPQNIGFYIAQSPDFVYLPDTELSFWYKYKMPMYGCDGIYFIINYEGNADTLLFIGAGGALPSREPNLYIENDWVKYCLNLDDILINSVDLGVIFTIDLIFKFEEEIPDFNQYGTMLDIGVFLDDFNIKTIMPFLPSEDEFNPADIAMKFFPNPVNPNSNLNISFNLSKLSQVSAKVFNIKGQLVKDISNNTFGKGIYNMVWNGKNNQNEHVASGIYFIKIEINNRIISRKILLMK